MDSGMLKQTLESFHLSRAEADIVYELAGRGICSIGVLVKVCGRHRGTLYNSLNRLIERGFVSVSCQDNTKSYSLNEDSFLGVIEQERKNIQKMSDCIKHIRRMGDLSRKIAEKPEIPVRFTYGSQAFKNFFAKLLADSAISESDYLTYCNGGEMQDALGKEYYTFSQQLKSKIGASSKVLLNRKSATHPFSNEVKGNIRWIDNIEFPTQGFVKGDNFYLVDWASRPQILIEIQNKKIADSYRHFFNSLWKNDMSPKERRELKSVVVVCDDKEI